jgi:hypothetical protein
VYYTNAQSHSILLFTLLSNQLNLNMYHIPSHYAPTSILVIRRPVRGRLVIDPHKSSRRLRLSDHWASSPYHYRLARYVRVSSALYTSSAIFPRLISCNHHRRRNKRGQKNKHTITILTPFTLDLLPLYNILLQDECNRFRVLDGFCDCGVVGLERCILAEVVASFRACCVEEW